VRLFHYGCKRVLNGQRETIQRQLNAEKKKQKYGSRVKSLNKTFSATHEKITMAEEMMHISELLDCLVPLIILARFISEIPWMDFNDKNPAVRKPTLSP
ncbi:hypothetical protein SUGI_0863620, partial [Cryptomeria japonica]